MSLIHEDVSEMCVKSKVDMKVGMEVDMEVGMRSENGKWGRSSKKHGHLGAHGRSVNYVEPIRDVGCQPKLSRF